MKFKRTTNPAGSVENQQGLKYKWSYITLYGNVLCYFT